MAALRYLIADAEKAGGKIQETNPEDLVPSQNHSC